MWAQAGGGCEGGDHPALAECKWNEPSVKEPWVCWGLVHRGVTRKKELDGQRVLGFKVGNVLDRRGEDGGKAEGKAPDLPLAPCSNLHLRPWALCDLKNEITDTNCWRGAGLSSVIGGKLGPELLLRLFGNLVRIPTGHLLDVSQPHPNGEIAHGSPRTHWGDYISGMCYRRCLEFLI